MKHLLIICFAFIGFNVYGQEINVISASAQTASPVDGDKWQATNGKTFERINGRTVEVVSDSTIVPYSFTKTIKADLERMDEELKKLTDRYEQIIKEKDVTLRTATKIICDENGIAIDKTTIQSFQNDGVTLKIKK